MEDLAGEVMTQLCVNDGTGTFSILQVQRMWPDREDNLVIRPVCKQGQHSYDVSFVSDVGDANQDARAHVNFRSAGEMAAFGVAHARAVGCETMCVTYFKTDDVDTKAPTLAIHVDRVEAYADLLSALPSMRVAQGS